MKVFAVIALACAAALGAQKAPVDWVNTLVGTASLDRQDFIGNAPPTVGGFPPFDPQEPYYAFMMKEASGWSTLWLAPEDIDGLIGLLGGRDKFNDKLDEFFNTPYRARGICRDCTGMIGQYVQGNQPDQQAAYYYDWGGQPWKTQQVVRRILAQLYGSDKYGLGFPGMDDEGSLSSWYALSAMGFFPVDPATENYAIGNPLFGRFRSTLRTARTSSLRRGTTPRRISISSPPR